MLPILTLIVFMWLILILGGQQWNSKATKYAIIGVVAVLQTALILFDMFTMKVPKF